MMEPLPLAHSMTWEVMPPNSTATFRPLQGWYIPHRERGSFLPNMPDTSVHSASNSTYLDFEDQLVDGGLDNYYLNSECACDSSLCQHSMMPMNDPSSMKYPWKSNPHFYPNILTYVATLLLGVTGNVAVIVVMRDQKTRTNTNMFLCSLSVADLIMLIFSVPIEILRMFVVILDLGSPFCTVGDYIVMLSFSASVLNLTAVSLERFIVIVFPMRSRSVCTMRNCRRSVFVVWLVAVATAVPVVKMVEEEPIVYHNDNCTEHVIAFYCKEHHDVWFVAYQVLALFVIPALLMICCYTAVIRELWKSTKNISVLTNSVRSSAGSETYRLKIRHSKICNPRRLLNPSSPAMGIQSYSNCDQGSPLPSISDPFGDQEDFAEKRPFDDDVQESGFTVGHPILSLDCDIPQSSSATLDSAKAFGLEKPPVASGAGLPLYLDYDTMSDVTEHTSQATRTSGLSFPRMNSLTCGRSNTISGTRNNSKGKSTSAVIFSPKEDFQVAEEDATGGNPRPSVGTPHNLKSPIGLRASMRNRHSFGSTSHNGGLNYKAAPFEENVGNLREKNSNPRGMFGHRRSRASTVTGSTHCREEWKMPPMAKREDVKKTRKQVIKMLVVVVVLFVLCWSPNLIVKICKSLNVQIFNQVFLSFTYLSKMLPFIHCCINPIIYCFMSHNFRKSMWRMLAKRQSCCSDLARSQAGLPPLRSGCCKCVRYGDGCCSGNSSNSGTGCSKMCCDKQNHLPPAPPVSRVETDAPKLDVVAPTSSAMNLATTSDWAPEGTRCPDKYSCGTACFYVCWCTKSLPQMPGIGSPETHKGISRQNTTRFSSSAYYHEAPTAILNCTELENVSNI